MGWRWNRETNNIARMVKEMKVVDLFCGCGGMSLGFQNAGFEIVVQEIISHLDADILLKTEKGDIWL